MQGFFTWSLLVAASVGVCAAQKLEPIDDAAKASYFVLKSAGYVFALNVVENGDVYYHMNAPSSHAWMGIGFGPSMTNTRMLISYVSEDGTNLTNSCRMSTGRNEPVDEPDIVIDPVYNDEYAPYANTLSPDSIMIAHAICRNCSKWSGGEIDVNSTAAQFIFAVGGNTTLRSDRRDASLRPHQFHGSFYLDMTKAVNNTGDYGRVPAPQDPGQQVGFGYSAFANYYSSPDFNTGTDHVEQTTTVHGVFMCVAFLLVFPTGSILLRLTKRALVHAAAQVVGVLLVAIGFGVGCYASTIYNKSKHFHSTHQVLGFLIVAALLCQVGLGLAHHAFYIRTKSPSIMGAVHRLLGTIIIVLGLVNAGVGFNFAGNSPLPYSVVAGVMAIVFATLVGLIVFYNRRNTYKPEKGPYIPSDQYHDEPEYEMSEQPFTNVAYVQTPRTPRYADGQGKTENASHYHSQMDDATRNDSLRIDTAVTNWHAIR